MKLMRRGHWRDRLSPQAVRTAESVASAGVSSARPSSKVTIAVGRQVVGSGAKKLLEAKYPNVTLKKLLIAGGEPDFLTKLALLYHSASTSPDVAQFPSTYIALYESSGWLMPMDKYLKGLSWFRPDTRP